MIVSTMRRDVDLRESIMGFLFSSRAVSSLDLCLDEKLFSWVEDIGLELVLVFVRYRCFCLAMAELSWQLH